MSSKEWQARTYHKLVWGTAKQDTESYFYSDRRSWIGNIVSGVGSAAFIPYILDLWKGSEMTMPFFAQVILFLFSGVFGLAIYIVGLYLWNGFWFVPAKMFRDEQTKARKYTWDDVFFECFTFPENSPVSIGIYVKSAKPSLLKDINANIVSIEHKGQDILDKSLPLPTLTSNKKFDWSITDIEFGESKKFVLFKTNLRGGMREYSDALELFIPAKGSQPDNFEPAQYFEEHDRETLPVYVTIDFHGNVDGHAIYPDKRLVYRVDCRNNKPIVELAGES